MSSQPPPLSAVLLLGLPLSVVPRGLLDLALAEAVRRLARRYPRIFERLTGLGGARFLVEPSDLPISFDLRLDDGRPMLRVADGEPSDLRATVIVRGPLADLLALLEGRLDGDALFFSRRLSVEGDMEAIVTLRNAVEGEEVNLLELLLESAGPFGALLRAGHGPATRVYRVVESALTGAQRILNAPLSRDVDEHERRLSELATRLAEIERAAARRRGRTEASAP